MTATVIRADARNLPLEDASVDLVVTSPPYFGLRSYTDGGTHYAGQIGSENTPAEWVAALVACTAEWARVLKPSGSIFVNLGDKYAGGAGDQGGIGKRVGTDGYHYRAGKSDARNLDSARIRYDWGGARPKSLLGLPWRYALACMDELGLILRRDIIWSKPNGLPESVTDRCRSSHEYLFHLVKQPRYYAAVDEIREPHTGGTHARRKDGQHSPKEQATISNGFRRGYFPEDRENPLGKLPGSVWDIPSQPLQVPASLGVDHFAAFPMELPRRCIQGWSPPGVCSACHQGRRPVVDNSEKYLSRPCGAPYVGKPAFDGPERRRYGSDAGATAVRTIHRITGYACGCPEPTAPTTRAVVLDPFGGTGTTALVASVLGRHGITADLSADYCRLAAWRTTDPGERARAMQVPKPPPIPDGQEALWV